MTPLRWIIPRGDAASAATVSRPNDTGIPVSIWTIAAPFGWGRLIEVQGFGQRFVDPELRTLGTVDIKANAISRFITFAVEKAALGGAPASGWAFTVVLTGQDGYSPDQARAFAATPQPYQFGVCAAASADPRCAVDPALVPKVMDTLPPAGVAQSVELDYTRGPVELQGLAVP